MQPIPNPSLSPRLATLYCDLMEEIKRRIDVISGNTVGGLVVPEIVGVELVYLQFRMICELIALACLTVHGDVPETKAKRLTKAYNADQIIKALENLHPEFYPVPGRQVRDETGKVLELTRVDDPYLTKRELQRLYGECGNFLHRGNIEQFMKGKGLPKPLDLEAWKKKITNLLNHHQIQLFDPKRQLWVIMQAESDGKVHAFEFYKVDNETCLEP